MKIQWNPLPSFLKFLQLYASFLWFSVNRNTTTTSLMISRKKETKQQNRLRIFPFCRNRRPWGSPKDKASTENKSSRQEWNHPTPAQNNSTDWSILGNKYNSISPITSRAPCNFLSSRSIADFKVIGYFWQEPEFRTGIKNRQLEARKRNTTMPGLYRDKPFNILV